jgi:phosphatidylethanolamine/phosphatidyl-N-methylethanolamine N-methyltransferase
MLNDRHLNRIADNAVRPMADRLGRRIRVSFGSGAAALDLASIRRAYRRYAGIYDTIFGAILEPGRRVAATLANNRSGERVLEVGVGTGLSLPAYRSDVRVVGIDISTEMLARARQRVARLKLRHVEALAEMDAQDIAFPDDSFDTVVAAYTASVVPSVERVVSEMRRVCRPGGRIVIVNHFASPHPLMRRIERALAPLSAKLGFRPDLDLAQFVDLMGLEPVEIRDSNLFGYWKAILFRNG